MTLQVLDVFLYEQPIGTLTHLPGDSTLFAFNQEYIQNPSRPTLSLSFKGKFGELTAPSRPIRRRVPPFFSNLLPEGHLRDYLAAKVQVNPDREFPLLQALGNDLPGAVRVGESTALPSLLHPAQKVVEESEDVLHFSLAGVQLKFSAIWENHGGLTIPAHGVGGAWIVKLPSAIYTHVPENEYSMMELARRIGIDVPETALVSLNKISGLPRDIEQVGTQAYVIKRFDRGAHGEAIHIEDFAQVFGLFPEKKYSSASYRNIAEVIGAELGDAGVREFVRRFVFNALIGNGDMHLKNWSLIYPDRITAKLAPAYDFVSTIFYLPGDGLALNFVDSKLFSSLSVEQFKRFAAKSRISEKIIVETVRETISRFENAWKTKSDLPADEKVIQAIDRHLGTIPMWNDR